MLSPEALAARLYEVARLHEARVADERQRQLLGWVTQDLAGLKHEMEERHARKLAQWERQAPQREQAMRAMEEANRRMTRQEGARRVAAFLPARPGPGPQPPQVW